MAIFAGGGARRAWLAGLVLAAALAALGPLAPPLRAAETLHRFAPADPAALRAWGALLRQDAALARDARRQGFRPARDLAMLRTDLNDDGRPELLLLANLRAYCGSAGCLLRILSPDRRGSGWLTVCETALDDGVPLVVEDRGRAGWRTLRGTYRVSWRADARRPLGIACVEGAAIDRAAQGRLGVSTP